MKTKLFGLLVTLVLVLVALVVSFGAVSAQESLDPTTCGVQPSPFFTIVWGYMDIRMSPVAAGEVIEAWAGDTIVGCQETIEGGLPTTHIYGEYKDENGVVITPGASEGEEIRFKLNGEWLETTPSSFTFHNDWDIHQLYFFDTPYTFRVSWMPDIPEVGEDVLIYTTGLDIACEYSDFFVRYDDSETWETEGSLWHHTFETPGEHIIRVVGNCIREGSGAYITGLVEETIYVEAAFSQKIFLPLVIR